MTRALVVGLVWAQVARGTIARYWRRLLVGAVVGWALASAIGALVLALVDPYLGPDAEFVSAFVFVYGGIIAGALVAYSWRSRSEP